MRSFFNQRSGAKQEFTRPSTPEQNGHIEAFHSIIQRTICERFEFESPIAMAGFQEGLKELVNAIGKTPNPRTNLVLSDRVVSAAQEMAKEGEFNKFTREVISGLQEYCGLEDKSGILTSEEST